MTELISVTDTEDVCHIRLNRPDKMNALSSDLVEALLVAVDAAERRRCTVIALQGEGRNFSAGFDFGSVEAQSEGDLLLRFVRLETLLHKLASASALTIAFAHGKNFGAGVDLFGACHRRISTADATFRMPGLKFGLVLNTRRFSKVVGADAAREILGKTRPFAADEGHRLGFVTSIAARETWPEHVRAAIEDAKSLPASARKLLHDAISNERADQDLATLVRSASIPGLKDRIAAYLNPQA
ncbi:enoyl-CoA hydratase/isomerase family protein [Cupriavidus sp. 2SB]|uniref:enoyl-CoA hydratase/isomerase family protein n=1 Tax=Cupriavidus sp. 2SB TaxID=2502199 RepID=UPI0010F4960E|nr:enoyl-CoA hydratase/isomerase family protein [Cupriavidus sp. 2SB]